MKKKNVVRKAYEFEEIIKNGICCKNKYYVIHYKKNNLPYDRYGISVSKKLGNAVLRNKYKRKIRMIINNYKKKYINNEDCIIILRREAIGKKHELLENEFIKLLNNKKGHKNNEEKQNKNNYNN